MSFIALATACCFFVLAPFSPTQQPLPPEHDISACITQSRVCISTDAEDVTPDTEANLQRQLTDDDHIAIVMLSPSDATVVGNDLAAFAKKVDDLTGHRYIIGFTADGKAVGYASILPGGVAQDLMQRARNVSMNPVDTQITFIMNVHRWLSQHPAAALPAVTPTTVPTVGNPQPTVGFPIGFPIGAVIGVGVASWIIVRRNRVAREQRSEVRFQAPEPINGLLVEIMQLRNQVQDVHMQTDIRQICVDTEEYFKRNRVSRRVLGFSRNQYRLSSVELFRSHLENIRDVLVKYLDIQGGDRRYYKNADQLLLQGKVAVSDFASLVLGIVQDDTDVDSIEYTVKTDILSAQRNI